jgi:hypothetical protein
LEFLDELTQEQRLDLRRIMMERLSNKTELSSTKLIAFYVIKSQEGRLFAVLASLENEL